MRAPNWLEVWARREYRWAVTMGMIRPRLLGWGAAVVGVVWFAVTIFMDWLGR